MTELQLRMPLFRLPVELRDLIYHDLIPHEVGRDFGRRCPTILLINRQIYHEASRVLYDRTYTITVTAGSIAFHSFFCQPDGSKDITTIFPSTFPYHRVKALRICVRTPASSPYSDQAWSVFEWNLWQSARVLAIMRFRKLIIDVEEPCRYHRPARCDGNRCFINFYGRICPRDIRRLFSALTLRDGVAETCEICLKRHLRTDLETVQQTTDWARTLVRHDNGGVLIVPSKEDEGPERGEDTAESMLPF